MNSTYADWIGAFEKRHDGFVRGHCAEAVREMVAAFPELRAAVGFATWVAPHGHAIEDQHHWCVGPDGSIVDPTASQFSHTPLYDELDLNKPEDLARIPTGMCHDCGDPLYSEPTGTPFCSEACEVRTMRDMGCHRLPSGSWQS